jgi:hypothetical protein
VCLYARPPQERIQALNVDMKKARVYLTTLVSEQNSVYMVSDATSFIVEQSYEQLKKCDQDRRNEVVCLYAVNIDGQTEVKRDREWEGKGEGKHITCRDCSNDLY